MVREIDSINKLIDTFDIDINKKKIDETRNFYLDYSGEKYSDKLFRLTKKIIND